MYRVGIFAVGFFDIHYEYSEPFRVNFPALQSGGSEDLHMVVCSHSTVHT